MTSAPIRTNTENRILQYEISLRESGSVRINITKEDLYNLYIIKKLSSRKIAKIYKCAYSTIDNKIRKFRLPPRTLSQAHITTYRSTFSGNSKDKAYIIGFRIGDLRVRKMYKHSETILVDCGSTKKEQINLIKNLFRPYGRIWISKPNRNRKVQIECSLNNSFKFLIKKYKRFPTWAMNNPELCLNIIAGFVDAEGSFFIYHAGKCCAFSIGNYNLQILKQIRGWLDKLKIRTRLFLSRSKGYVDKQGYISNGNYWILSITKKSEVFRFTNMIRGYLKHEGKIRDANKILDNINERNVKFGYIGM